MLRAISWLSILSLSLSLAACGDEKDGTSAANEEEGGTGSAEEDEGMQDPPRPAAGGIAIRKIYANQGVQVPIAEGDAWVGASGRPTVLAYDRTTMIRVLVDVAEDWEPRDIDLDFVLEYEDGEVLSDTVTTTISKSSLETNLSSTINIPLPGEYVKTGMKFQVSLLENDPYATPPASIGPTVSPATPEFVGIEGLNRFIAVNVIPIKHDIGAGCAEAPQPSERAISDMAKWLKAQNPVNAVYMNVLEPIVWDEPLENLFTFSPVLSYLAQLREQLDMAPGDYVFGIIDPCDAGPNGVGGEAIDIPGPPSMFNDTSRVSVGLWSEISAGESDTTIGNYAAETFVHEVGHTQGRRHSPCGEAGGPDPGYPYPGGIVGAYSWKFIEGRANEFFAPDGAYDYMGYCDPTSVSPYVYNQVLGYITTISGWGAPEGQSPTADSGTPSADEASRQILVGLLDASGDTHWHTANGVVDEREWSTSAVAIVTTEEDTYELPVVATVRGDSDGMRVAMNLPESLEANLPDIVSVRFTGSLEDRSLTMYEASGEEIRAEIAINLSRAATYVTR